jgi:hypothetical protein
VWAWAPAAVTVAAGAVAGYFFVQARTSHDMLVAMPTGPTDVLDATQARRIASEGSVAQAFGYALAGLALVSLIATVALVIFSGP